MNSGTIAHMDPPVKPSRRAYRSPQRAAAAQATRHAVLEAARSLFTERGYAKTGMTDIAARAGVAVDTIYASVGRKPDLMRALLETAISGTDEAVPPEERDYVQRIRSACTAGAKLAVYAQAVASIGVRMAPVHRALREAALTDAACAALRDEISARRAANMEMFAADLRSTGEVRDDLTDRDVADIVWSMNDADYYALLVGGRGWSPERFAGWLSEAWTRTLLRENNGESGAT
jgi:AcrR family transcriptional regulator